MTTIRQPRIGSTTMTTSKAGTVTNSEEAWAAAIVQREGVLEAGKTPIKIAMDNRNLDDVQADRWGKWLDKYWKTLSLRPTSRQLVLREVNFSGNSLTSMGVRCILAALKRIQVNVQVLKFFQNRIESAKDVVEFLHWNEGNLRELHLSHNRLDTASARDIILGVAAAADTEGNPRYPFPFAQRGLAVNVPLWLRLEGNILNAGNLKVELLAALAKLGRPLKSVVCEVDSTSPCHTMLCKETHPPAVHLTYLNMASTAPTQQAGRGPPQPAMPPTGPAVRAPGLMKAKAAAAAGSAAATGKAWGGAGPRSEAPPSKSGGSVWGGAAPGVPKGPQPGAAPAAPGLAAGKAKAPSAGTAAASTTTTAAAAATGAAGAAGAAVAAPPPPTASAPFVPPPLEPSKSATVAWLDGGRPDGGSTSAGPPTKAKPPPPRDPPAVAEASAPPTKISSKAPAPVVPQKGPGSSTPEALSGEDESESDRGSFGEGMPPAMTAPLVASTAKQQPPPVAGKKAKAPPPEDPMVARANQKANAKAKSKAPGPSPAFAESPDPLVSSAATWMTGAGGLTQNDPLELLRGLPPPDMAPPLPPRAVSAGNAAALPPSASSPVAASSAFSEESGIAAPHLLTAASSAPPGLSPSHAEEARMPSSPPPPMPSLARSVSAVSAGSSKILPPAPTEAPPLPPSEMPPPAPTSSTEMLPTEDPMHDEVSEGVDRQTSGLEEVVNLEAMCGMPGLLEEPQVAAVAEVAVEKQLKVVVKNYRAEAPGYLSVAKGARVMVYKDIRAPGEENCAYPCYVFGESFDQANEQGWLPEEVAWERYTDANSGRVWLYEPLSEGFMWEDDLLAA